MKLVVLTKCDVIFIVVYHGAQSRRKEVNVVAVPRQNQRSVLHDLWHLFQYQLQNGPILFLFYTRYHGFARLSERQVGNLAGDVLKRCRTNGWRTASTATRTHTIDRCVFEYEIRTETRDDTARNVRISKMIERVRTDLEEKFEYLK